MIDEAVNRLPVVDDDGKLIGIVTRADLVRAFVRSDEEIGREIREDVIRRRSGLRPSRSTSRSTAARCAWPARSRRRPTPS